MIITLPWKNFVRERQLIKKEARVNRITRRKTLVVNKCHLILHASSFLLAGVGTTKRLPKATPSCVKRQTPKAALKNVSRPRNRFANEPNSQIKQNPPPKDNRDFKINDIQNLFNNDYFKATDVSQLAQALVQALRQVGQATKLYVLSTNFFCFE